MNRNIQQQLDLLQKIQVLSRANLAPALLLSGSQVFLAILDLVGVGLVATGTAIASSEFTRGEPGDFSKRVLGALNLESENIRIQVTLVVLVGLLFLVAKTVLSLFLFWLSLRVVQRKSIDLSQKFIDAFYARPIPELASSQMQNSVWALTSGLTLLVTGIYRFLLGFLGDFLLLVVLLIGLLFVDWASTLIAFSLFSLTSILTFIVVNNRALELASERSSLDIRSSQLIYQSVVLIKELLLLGKLRAFVSQINTLRDNFVEISTKLRFTQSISKYVMELVMVVCLTVLGVFIFTSNDLSRSVALFTLFVAASARIMPAMVRLQSGYLDLKVSLASGKDTIVLVDSLAKKSTSQEESAKLDKDSPMHKDTTKIAISFVDVEFGYTPEEKIVSNLNVEIYKGELFGISGVSGAGKSTLIDLMLGFNRPSVGYIEVLGKRVDSSFHKHITEVALVPQAIQILDGSLYRNITLSFDYSTEEAKRVQEIVSFVGLKELFRDDFEGVRLGESGYGLSGGQKQRLGLARALFASPKILILDEGTNALDVESETDIVSRIRSSFETTIVVITHRRSILQLTDRILFLEGPLQNEVSNYETLIKNNQKFKSQLTSSKVKQQNK